MEIQIQNKKKHKQIRTSQILRTAETLLNALGKPDAELSILVVSDDEIAEMNRQYLQRQGPTNVISFPMNEGEFNDINPELLGDVVISVDTAEREAKEAGIDIIERFNDLLIHGILHLLGYDHETGDADAERMAEKSKYLKKILQTKG